MQKLRTFLAAILAIAIVSGCAGGPFADMGLRRLEGAPYLKQGIAHYEEGNYRSAVRRLQFALEEGLTLQDRVQAHKYLAFISCVSGQQLTCREEFAIALDLDPKFELTAAEAGHPMWGPVFKSVKSVKR
jgi:Tfp pilus assembly protein PilF